MKIAKMIEKLFTKLKKKDYMEILSICEFYAEKEYEDVSKGTCTFVFEDGSKAIFRHYSIVFKCK